MKRLVSMLLVLLMLALLPVTAFASNEYYEEGILVSNPEELKEALVDPSDDILISHEFVWGGEDKVLIIDFYGNSKTDYGRDVPDIKLMGSWTIPEDWTVILYEQLRYCEEVYDCDITVDGSLNIVDSGYIQPHGYSDNDQLVVNGALVTSPTNQTQLSGFSDLIINGHFENPYRCTLPKTTVNSGATMAIGDTIMTCGLNLPNGIHLTGSQISMYGDLTVNGSAIIDNYVDFYEDAVLTGNLIMDRVRVRNITIPAGSTVHTNSLSADGYQFNIGGKLSIGGSYQSVYNSALQLDGGTIVIQPWVQFSDSDRGTVITGTGTLELYAEYRSDFDTYNGYPRLFGLDSDEGISDCVASTVTVWRNWADCDHAWTNTGVVVEPNCYYDGYTVYACSVCGSEIHQDIVPATGEHELSYAPDEYSPSYMQVSCAGCGVTNTVGIYVESSEVEFEGTPIKNAHVFCDGFLIPQEELPEIIYVNNDMEGVTATAFAEVGGITISVTFQIVSCAHEVGTPANCQRPAVCGKCGMFFGELADHVWAKNISRNDSIHYFECTVEGCDSITSEEEMYGLLPPELLEEWEILRYQNEIYDGTILDHIYADEASEAAGDCLICASVSAGNPNDDGNMSGTCGDDLTWKLDGEGVLTISGNGPMWDFVEEVPGWNLYGGSLTHVVIEPGVTSIGAKAFSMCGMTSIEIPDTVTSIGTEAFFMSDLKAVVIPESVTQFGKGIFQDSMLIEVALPDNMTEIPADMFHNCSELIFVEIPESVTSIGDYAFFNTGINQLTIPAGVTSVGYLSFGNYWAVEEAVIIFQGDAPDIVDGAFGFQNVTVYYPGGNNGWEETVANYVPGELDSVTFVAIADENPPSNPDEGSNVTWNVSGNTLTISGKGAVQGYDYGDAPWYSYAEEIELCIIESGITGIGEGAFFGMDMMKAIVLPDTMADVNYFAFMASSSMEFYEVDKNNPYYSNDEFGVLFNKDKSELIRVPTALSGKYVVPASVKVIQWNAFNDCVRLTDVVFQEGLEVLSVASMNACYGLTEIFIPASLSEIQPNVFDGCISLKRFNVHEDNPNYSSDENGFLYNKDKSRLMVVPGGFQDDDGVFSIPEHVACIDSWAFGECDGVKELLIPASVEKIDSFAFCNAGTLEKITFAGDAPEIGINAFANDTISIYYPAGNGTWSEEIMTDYGGTITWIAYSGVPVPGDVGGDGIVDSSDVALLLWYTLFPTEYGISGDADFNGDGKVDDSDVAYLLWHILFPKDYPL